MQKNLYDIGWSDESECQAFHKEEGTEKWQEIRREIPEPFRKWEQQAKTRAIVTHPLNESQWNRPFQGPCCH